MLTGILLMLLVVDRLWHERAGDRQKDIGVLCKYRRDEG